MSLDSKHLDTADNYGKLRLGFNNEVCILMCVPFLILLHLKREPYRIEFVLVAKQVSDVDRRLYKHRLILCEQMTNCSSGRTQMQNRGVAVIDSSN